MNSSMIVHGKRRFTCLTSRLVRMEFSPDGRFEDRRSMVAYAHQQPISFDAVSTEGDVSVLQVGNLTIRSSQNDRDFFSGNLRVDWKRDGLTETWQFGDRDYCNLGGTVRSLDYYTRDGILNGVHLASNDSPNAYLHSEAEFWDVRRVYQDDGSFAMGLALSKEGVHGALAHHPELVYNRHIPMAHDYTKYQPGLLSRNGYFLLNDSVSPVLNEQEQWVERNRPGTRDLYLFVYGSDYNAALQDYRLLTGGAPLPERSVFGTFFCRWPAFNEEEAKNLIERFEIEGIPLSTLVLDLEWHTPDFWGWDWNSEAFPQPEEFIEWVHERGVKVMLNVHPKIILSADSHFEQFVTASGTRHKVIPVPAEYKSMGLVKSDSEECVEINLALPSEAQAYTQVCLAPLQAQGVDYWWLDMNSADLNGADGQILSSDVFYQATQVQGRRGRLQGRYGGLGSHRYGIFFTGDTASQWEVLQSECEFTIRAGQVGMAYVSHDIGGFSHEPAPLIDPDLYIRWLQYGVFSPVLRFHSAPEAGSRQPWDYGARNLAIAKRWLTLRALLIPYLYTAAWQMYQHGLPLVRALYLESPQDEAAYRWDEYLLGDSLLVAPILTPRNHRRIYLPAGDWYIFESAEVRHGPQEFSVYAGLDEVPVFVKAGTILTRQENPRASGRSFVDDLVLEVYTGADGEALLYEDDGESMAYTNGDYCLTQFHLTGDTQRCCIEGKLLEGKPMAAERTIQLRVYLPDAPQEVEWMGDVIDHSQWFYDEQHVLTVSLATQAVDASWRVCIHCLNPELS